VQIVGGLGLRAVANTNRSAAPSTRGHGARTAAYGAEPTGGELETAPTRIGAVTANSATKSQ
jgi:hypothetical protein